MAGAIYHKQGYYCLRSLLRAMLAAMVAGRIVWGLAMMLLMGIKGGAFTFSAFMAGAVINAVPGIILQLVLIPALMLSLSRAGLLPGRKKAE